MKRCYLCSQPAQTHHIFSRGAWREAALVPENEFPLCACHHAEAHKLGRCTWAKRYLLEDRVEKARKAVLEAWNRLYSWP